METTDPIDINVLRAFLDAFNRHDVGEIMSFFGDHPVLDSPRGPDAWGTRAEGREEVQRLLVKRFEGLPNVHYGEDRHFACGSRGVSEWLLTGTTGDGKETRVRGCDLFEFEGGKISRKDSYWKIVE